MSLPLIRKTNKEYHRKAGGLLLAAFALSILLAFLLRRPESGNEAKSAPQIFEKEPEKPSSAGPFAVKVETDTNKLEKGDMTALKTLLTGTMLPESARFAALNGGTPQAPQASEDPAPDWFLWARLTGTRAKTTVSQPEEKKENGVAAYASQTADSATLCLVNRANQKARVTVRIRLGQGVYTVERLDFAPKNAPETITEPAALGQENEASAANTVEGRLTRLEGVDVGSAAFQTKTLFLAPNRVCLLRFTDAARNARAAYQEANRLLGTLAQSAPRPAHRLKDMLQEGSGSIGSINGGSRSSAAGRVGSAHRLLLIAAQVQSLHRNFLTRKTVPSEVGGDLMGILERLSDSLAESSATMLILVPRIEVRQEPMKMASGPRSVRQEPDTADTRISTVTVSLINSGPQPIAMVRLGLDTSMLPDNVRCEQGDSHSVGTLAPGRTAKATFTLRGSSRSTFRSCDCVADIAYHRAGVLAHLRSRPW